MRLGKPVHGAGFTLIELMIGVVIFAFLAVLALPMYGDFMASTQVRTAADSVLNGIRLAQTEAVRRSIPVRFELVGTNGWQVVFHADEHLAPACGATADCTSDSHLPTGTDCPAGTECVIRAYSFTTGGAANVTLAGTGGSVVTFSSLGFPLATNNDNSAELQFVDFTNGAYSGTRRLRVYVGGLVNSAGGTKLCDRDVASTDPMACPAS